MYRYTFFHIFSIMVSYRILNIVHCAYSRTLTFIHSAYNSLPRDGGRVLQSGATSGTPLMPSGVMLSSGGTWQVKALQVFI